MPSTAPTYPIQFDIDYPDRPLNRVTTFFRLIVAVPILIVLTTIGATTFAAGRHDGASFAGIAAGMLFIPPLLMIVFRQKYPRWWFDFNIAYLGFHNRVIAFVLLLRDEYPSTEAEQAVHLQVPYPEVSTELNRWMPLVKWFLAVPHYLALIILDIAVVLAVIAAWFAIVFTGRYPRSLFSFIVGAMRWHNRVIGYAFALVTDRYPPFRLAA
jgi:hypothetical protein